MSDYKTYEVKVWADGDKQWYLNGKLHREDGPAVERSDGYKEWWLNDYLHREDGPAIEWADGTKYWYLNGNFHREDGPAVEFDGDKWWYLHGKELTEEEHRQRTTGQTCNGKIVEIDGIKYKLTEV